MVMKISAGEGMKRGDLFFVDPFEVIVKEDLRGRHTPPTEENILKIASSMITEGQLQPVSTRRVEGSRLQLTLGFTRTAAARLIRTGFTDLHGEAQCDPEFKLQVKVVDCNDQEAFRRNIVENAQRNQTSPIDDALNQQRLRETYGYSDADISRLYGETNGNRVCRLRKLLQLEPDLQAKVHDGSLPMQGAIDLLDVPPEKREEIVSAIVTEEGKVNGAEIRAQVREHHLNDDNKDTTGGDTVAAPAKKITLSMKEVRKYFETWTTGEEGEVDPALVRFSKDMLAWLNGKKTPVAMDNAVNRLLDAKRTVK